MSDPPAGAVGLPKEVMMPSDASGPEPIREQRDTQGGPDPGQWEDELGGHTIALQPLARDGARLLGRLVDDVLLVPVDRARSITQFTAMVSAAARGLPPGAWLVTSMGWHESYLAESRLPTGAELDAAAPGHPVLARRGEYLAVASAAALAAAGIGRGTPDPPGGKIGRHEDGRPDGLLEGRAVYQVAASARSGPC